MALSSGVWENQSAALMAALIVDHYNDAITQLLSIGSNAACIQALK
jgi:hypothetical protein